MKIDTNRQQGGREQGAGGKELETNYLYQVFREMALLPDKQFMWHKNFGNWYEIKFAAVVT